MILRKPGDYPDGEGADRLRLAGTFLTAGSTEEARAIQEQLIPRRILERSMDTRNIRTVAGGDAAYDGDRVCAAVAVLSFPGLEAIETACARCRVSFPYVPGFFAFREGPALLEAFARLASAPDILILNGHGYAHPDRFGLASHIGVLLDIPVIGVARRLLAGTAGLPGPERGSTAAITDRGGMIGTAVRTIAGKKPVYVSAGHRTDPEQAVEVVLAAAESHPITEPLWYADRAARECIRRRNG